MKIFSVKYKDSWGNILWPENIEAKDIFELKNFIQKYGFELVEDPIELEKKDSWLDKIKSYFSTTFSSYVRFNEEEEMKILSAYAESRKDGFPEKEALETTKTIFSKSDKRIHWAIDKLIDTFEKWVRHSTDIFTLNDDMFSPDFINLLESSKKVQIDINEIISNEVPDSEKNKKVAWYVQLKESILALKKEIILAITMPLLQFGGLFILVMLILIFLVPKLLDATIEMSRGKPIELTFISKISLNTSYFVLNYGFYLLIFLLLVASFITFLYRNNESFREQFQLFFLRIPVISEILIVITTRSLVSYMAIYTKAWERFENIFRSMQKNTPLIPIKKELAYIQNWVKTQNFENIFNSYDDDDKFLTEMFYLQLAQQSNSKNGKWYFDKAFAVIIKNTDDRWKYSLNKYPKRFGFLVKVIWFSIVILLILWTALILLSASSAGL